MKRIYVSCTERVIGERYVSDLVLLDLDKNWILASRPIEIGVDDPTFKVEQSGSSYGGRGVCWHRGELVLAIHPCFLHVLDPDTLETRSVRRVDEAKEIHYIRSHDDVLHLCSTWSNSVVRVDGGRVTSELVLGDDVRPHVSEHRAQRPDYQDHLHFNAIAWHPSTGDEYHLYSHPEIIYNWTQREITWKGSQDSKGAHDLCFLDDQRLVLNSSWERETQILHLDTGEIECVYEEPGKTQLPFDVDHAKVGWLRGLVVNHHNEVMLVTAAPGLLRVLELETWKLVKSMSFSTHPFCAPFDIALHPEDW